MVRIPELMLTSHCRGTHICGHVVHPVEFLMFLDENLIIHTNKKNVFRFISRLSHMQVREKKNRSSRIPWMPISLCWSPAKV